MTGKGWRWIGRSHMDERASGILREARYDVRGYPRTNDRPADQPIERWSRALLVCIVAEVERAFWGLRQTLGAYGFASAPNIQ